MSSDRAGPLPPTPIAKRFVRYLVGFGVGVGLGSGPFLGTLGVPGFSALIDLFPITLQGRIVALSPFLMGLVALAVQFYDGERISRRALRRRFKVSFVLLIAGFLLFVVLYFLFVRDVTIRGGEATARYVVGWERVESCGCAPQLSDAECIAELSLDPARVESCWGTRSVSFWELSLTLTYLLLIGGFAALVGLVLLRDRKAARD